MSGTGLSPVLLSAAFDGIHTEDIRLLDRASRLGAVHVFLWNDETVEKLNGRASTFPLEERLYYLESVRYVKTVTVVKALASSDVLPIDARHAGGRWVVSNKQDTPARRAYCREQGLAYHVVPNAELASATQLPVDTEIESVGSRKKVLVTGCFDWLHTGHIRFFEEVSELGDLYVVVGHDANIRALKGTGHPMFPEDVRRYLVGSIRFVTQALISTGEGWLDAEPEIICIHPDIYAVNEDGDKPIKREYCAANGIEYVVFKRLPKPGLPRRESTQLRGF